ncbi:hypothetical protein OHT76_00440 [Streptomyces sp. NBC_00287]|uniref:hypothetical protein n=1 Tax=Streptomyces sp. NBC_00287 TaxID=2975702 RepID=UPI002E2C31D6|nr:hypothetical protein [Streptomyces sp. NBC_00287]
MASHRCARGGLLLAGAAEDADDVLSGPAAKHDGERLRLLSMTEGPVTIRVYVPDKGHPAARYAEYQVEEGRSFSVRFSDPGKPVEVSPPADDEQVVSSNDVLAVLQHDTP